METYENIGNLKFNSETFENIGNLKSNLETIVNIGNLKFNWESFQVKFQGFQWKPMNTLETLNFTWKPMEP